MCRSVGIPARVVTGFMASEYNDVGDYYVIRPSHAHAWTEVHGGPGVGWYTLDATPPGVVESLASTGDGPLNLFRELYEHLEFGWVRTVVAYDSRTREAALEHIQAPAKDAVAGWTWPRRVFDWLRTLPTRWRFDRLGYTLAGLVVVLLAVASASLARLLYLRRKRVQALQLTSLPRAQRRTLAKRLRFYLRMLEMLERHGHSRPEWQSPYSFAQELASQHVLKFDPVVSLTELFYEVRFGHRPLTPQRRDQVRAHLRQLEHTLAAKQLAPPGIQPAV
jgi:hypothetical protein